MERLNQPAALQNALKKNGILEMFDTPNLDFRLLRFRKGEYLASPEIEPEYLLFLIRGSVQIYNLMEDSSLAPVGVQNPGAILGDIEFITNQPTLFFVEAKTEVTCVGLSISAYRAVFRQDVRFLNTLLDSVCHKLKSISMMDVNNRTLRERLLYYLSSLSPDGCIHSVNEIVMQLRCSRRQMQRVLSELCEEGILVRNGKGRYRLCRMDSVEAPSRSIDGVRI